MQSENDRGTEESLTADIAKIVKSIDFFILSKLVASNVEKAMDKVIRTHTKKFKQLTTNTVLPYSSNETVFNLSLCVLTSEQLRVLKNGFTNSISPPRISQSDA